MWNLGFDFFCCAGTSWTRQKHADTGSGTFLAADDDNDEEPGTAVHMPESARSPSVPKSTVAGSGSSAPRGGGAWVSIRALASAEAAAALLVAAVVVTVKRGERRRSNEQDAYDDDEADGRRLRRGERESFCSLSSSYCTISLTCPPPASETPSSCRKGRKRAS